MIYIRNTHVYCIHVLAHSRKSIYYWNLYRFKDVECATPASGGEGFQTSCVLRERLQGPSYSIFQAQRHDLVTLGGPGTCHEAIYLNMLYLQAHSKPFFKLPNFMVVASCLKNEVPNKGVCTV